MKLLNKPVTLTFLLFLVITTTATSFASDREKEKRWADQIADSLLDGDAIYLNDGEAEFLAIDTRADDPKDTGIIIIHGIGIHPDWETVIQPLRVQLAANGWNTLSLQMPILGNDATGQDYEPLMKEVPARIDAGIRQLTKSGAKKVIIIAHSMGSRMANYYLARKKVYQEAQTETPIVAYIGIGMGSSDDLDRIKIPVLDLFGEKDLPSVLSSAPLRVKASENNKNYKQQMIAGADHFFVDQDDELVKAVISALTDSNIINIKNAYVREVPPGMPTSASFLTLQNVSDSEISLTKVTGNIAKNIELHEHTHKNGMMEMRQVDKISIPANSSVELKPGGYHIMLIGLTKKIKSGDKVKLTLEFSNDTKKEITVEVKNIMQGMKSGS